MPADTGDYYENADRGELVYDDEFDLSSPVVQQWMLSIVDRVRTTSALQVDLGGLTQHPLEDFDAWLAQQLMESAAVREADAALDACVSAIGLAFSPGQQYDPTRPFIFHTLKGFIEQTVHEDDWAGMVPAFSLEDFGERALAFPGHGGETKHELEQLAGFAMDDKVMMRWRGNITVADEGEYRFATSSDDGSM